LPKVVTRQCPGAESNLRLWDTSGLQVRHVTVRLKVQVRVPIYKFQQTRVCMYFNGGHPHRRKYGLPLNFTCASNFYAGCVFV